MYSRWPSVIPSNLFHRHFGPYRAVPEMGAVVDEMRLKKRGKSNKYNKKAKIERKNGGNLVKTHQKSLRWSSSDVENGRGKRQRCDL